jgi:hypothetical protein
VTRFSWSNPFLTRFAWLNHFFLGRRHFKLGADDIVEAALRLYDTAILCRTKPYVPRREFSSFESSFDENPPGRIWQTVRHFKLGADDIVEAALRAKSEKIEELKNMEDQARSTKDEPFPKEVRGGGG